MEDGPETGETSLDLPAMHVYCDGVNLVWGKHAKQYQGSNERLE